MMFDIRDDLSIEVSKGDGGSFDVTFETDVPPNGTIALVSLKYSTDAVLPVWEKRYTIQNGQISVSISSKDTNFPPADYYWDICLLYEDGEPLTPISPPAVFRILEVAHNA